MLGYPGVPLRRPLSRDDVLGLLRRHPVRFVVERDDEVHAVPDAERCAFWASEARHRLAEGRWSAFLDAHDGERPVVRLVA